MLYILHGEDVVSSRKKMSEFVSDSANVVRIDGKKTGLSEIDTQFVSDSLFSDKKIIVIDFFTKVKPQKEFFEKTVGFQKDTDTDVILWEDCDLSAKVLNSFPLAKKFPFPFPKFYFAFLDGFVPHSKTSVAMLGDVLKTFEPEQILYGLTKRIRQLLIIKLSQGERFSEFEKMAPWQMEKLQKQAAAWTEAELKNTFVKLAELDEKIKTGALTLPLSAHLDILMVSDFN